MLEQPGIDAPPIRRRVVRAFLASRGRSWDNLSIDELIQIRDLMELNASEDPGNPWNIRNWFEAARRLSDTDIDMAIDKLKLWYGFNPRSLDVLYYLYVLYTLKTIDGSFQAKNQAAKYMNECKNRILPLAVGTQKFSFNWLGKSEGLPRLISYRQIGNPRSDPDWFRDEDGRTVLSRLPGIIIDIQGPTKGYIELRSGLRVYFTPGMTRRTHVDHDPSLPGAFVKSKDLNKDVDLFLGFSYEGLRAFDVRYRRR